MPIKTVFLLLTAVYVVLVIANSLRNNGTIGHNPVPYILLGIIFLTYVAFYVSVTLKLNKAGAFGWISPNDTIRNVALIAGSLAILYTYFNAIMIKSDWSTYQYQSISNPRDFLAYTAYIWVPLLVIIPYGLYINLSDTSFQTGASFRWPLIINVVIGCGIYLYFNYFIYRYPRTKHLSDEAYYNQSALDNIKYSKKVTDILYLTRTTNEKIVVDAAVTKVKSFADWEKQLSDLLSNCDPEDYFWPEVYYFLSTYSVDDSAKITEPFSKSITCLAAMVSKISENEYAIMNDLNALNIINMLSAIEYQFSEHFSMLDDELMLLSKTLSDVKRNDFKEKTTELVNAIESCRKKFL